MAESFQWLGSRICCGPHHGCGCETLLSHLSAIGRETNQEKMSQVLLFGDDYRFVVILNDRQIWIVVWYMRKNN